MVVKHAKKSRKKLGYNKRMGLRRRGKGNRGGVGAAGHGKRSAQKMHKFMKNGEHDYGKHGFASKKRGVKSVSVGILSEKAARLGEKKGDKYYINVNGKKVLGTGEVKHSLVITNYYSVTEKAKQKLVKAGGEVVER